MMQLASQSEQQSKQVCSVVGKVKAARWQPNSINVFATGSWGKEMNEVCIYEKNLDRKQGDDEEQTSVRGINLLGHANHDGDTTDLQWVSAQTVLTSSSNGNLCLYNFNPQQGITGQLWGNLGSAVSGVAAFVPKSRFGYFSPPKAEYVLAVMESGEGHLINLERKDPVSSLASSAALFAAEFATESSILVAGMGGRLLEWDVRAQPAKQSEKGFQQSRCLTAAGTYTDTYSPSLVSVAAHPTRDTIAATGSSNGLLSLWDRRRATQPVFSLEALHAPIWDVCFLPSNPTLLISADDEGVLRRWDFNRSGQAAQQVTYSQEQQHEVHMTTLFNHSLPINSISVSDLDETSILAGTDAESLLFYC